MVQSREKQLSESQNETKLEQVQLRFPSDDLFLNQTLNIMEVRVWVDENMCMDGNKLVYWVEAKVRPYQTHMQPFIMSIQLLWPNIHGISYTISIKLGGGSLLSSVHSLVLHGLT